MFDLDDSGHPADMAIESFRGQASPDSGMRCLWLAVILQAIMDAKSNSKKSENEFHRHYSRQWLEGASEDFQTVCEFAGMDEKYVREQLEGVAKRGEYFGKTVRPIVNNNRGRRSKAHDAETV